MSAGAYSRHAGASSRGPLQAAIRRPRARILAVGVQVVPAGLRRGLDLRRGLYLRAVQLDPQTAEVDAAAAAGAAIRVGGGEIRDPGRQHAPGEGQRSCDAELYVLADDDATFAACGPPALLPPSQAASVMAVGPATDRKSTRLNSSHDQISYAVFCLKKKKTE